MAASPQALAPSGALPGVSGAALSGARAAVLGAAAEAAAASSGRPASSARRTLETAGLPEAITALLGVPGDLAPLAVARLARIWDQLVLSPLA